MAVSKFGEYATSQAFGLSMSASQIRMLCEMHHYGFSCGYINTASALDRKGLCEWVESDELGSKFKLTEAGRAVVDLLKLAGLYPDFGPEPEKIERAEPKLKEPA